MKTNNKKQVIYIIILVILIFCATIAIIKIYNIHSERNIYEDKNRNIVKDFKNYLNDVNNENIIEDEKQNLKYDLKFEGYNVIGIISIPKIDLEYPILEQTTEKTMKISISRFWGGEVNSFGNLSLAGHNNYDGTMFGKNKNLQIGDIVELTDLNGKTIKYEIKEIFKTDPNDTSVLVTNNETIREVTLITCSKGRAERLIIKAFEINYLEENI